MFAKCFFVVQPNEMYVYCTIHFVLIWTSLSIVYQHLFTCFQQSIIVTHTRSKKLTSNNWQRLLWCIHHKDGIVITRTTSHSYANWTYLLFFKLSTVVSRKFSQVLLFASRSMQNESCYGWRWIMVFQLKRILRKINFWPSQT